MTTRVESQQGQINGSGMTGVDSKGGAASTFL
jgi:hypothetical protein